MDSTPPHPPTEDATSAQQAQQNILNAPVTDQNSAFNLIVSFVRLGHKRGVFSIEESGKIAECLNIFQPKDNK